jgi:peptide/nickel transport system substrate-binding protein
MRSRPTRALPAMAAALLLTAAGTAGTLASAPSAAAATTKSGTTLRMAMNKSGVDTLNPFLSYFDGALDLFGDIYPTLDTIRPNGTPGPYLATSWTTSPDKLTWTFKIRSGLKWSDGRPITAADAAWTFNLIMHNSTAATANGSLVSDFASVTAPDATTLVIRTKSPQSNMLDVSVPVNGIPIVPEHIWASHVSGLANYKNDSFPIVGYGPWTLKSYKTDQYATLDADKHFVLGAPKFDHMVVQIFKSQDAAIAALRSDQIDFIGSLEATQFQALRNAKSIKTYQEAGSKWAGLELNAGARSKSGKHLGTGNPALATPQVRQAIAMAIDRPALVDKVLDGLGTPGAGYLPPAWSQFHWAPSATQAQNYDPAKADALLDSAGFAKGAGGVRVDPKTHKPLVLRLGIHSNDSNDAQISSYLVGWLQRIGIKVEIQSMSMSTLNDNLAKGDWDMLMDSWSTGPDPTYLLGIQRCAALPGDNGTGGSTDAFYCDPAYDKLFDEQLTAFDPKQRDQIIDRMQQMLYQADSDIMLYYPNGLDASRTDTVSGAMTGSPGTLGLYPVQLGFWQSLYATPGTAKSGSGNAGLIGGVAGGVVVLVLIGFVFLKRRSSADERE